MEREGAKDQSAVSSKQEAASSAADCRLVICAKIGCMQHAHPARVRFRALIRQPEPRLNLAEAALCIAWEDQGHGRPEAALRELDELAEQARPRLAGSTQPLEIVIGLNSYLFGECGFHGNTWQYNDPANSFLDRVLATRAGLPITLCVTY